ncbi:urease subunit alpha [Marchantia polymorpha subsp. ruderalis]|uniref:Urease n=1 Tax=Marchantia polymorpha TaxID=3197 RepID=A0A2R6XAR1_MARPO|nr:hypothetical protein MARPO_0026s0042 [Marchantia polymorpha]BBN02160.1 hypothetical protein Mp_2g13300 [Marchantia polymorpha subsp. ruderalis]|eukprot:PTQ43159.1 hypothetical protein MARPO_0026s0042 [Marchantia polymorpha]
MKLLPREHEKLALHAAGSLAQKRLARGIRLNHPEAVALIATQVLEFIRDGDKSVSELMELGRHFLGKRQVLPAVPLLIESVQIEGTFPDGTKLVTVTDPFPDMDGDLEKALYGSFLPVPDLSKFDYQDRIGDEAEVLPSSGLSLPGKIMINANRKAVRLNVTNSADRPIQIGSHYHFIETNPLLIFDREKAYGKRLNILAGTAKRFEAGDTCPVILVEIGGNKRITGGNGVASGPVDPSRLPEIMKTVIERKFGHEKEHNALEGFSGQDSALTEMVDREKYMNIFGVTKGDKIRLGDTCLVVEVEKDFAIYGDECKFGGGKVLREGMGQVSGYLSADVLDVVITNALVIDYMGIYKADIGIKGGLIKAIGKAGNPDVMDGVYNDLVVGVNTEAIAGEGLILTAGGIDSHIHFICPQLVDEAIASGITTMIGGGTGPAHGSLATTCTPAPEQMRTMLIATDELPLNFGFSGKGNTSEPEGLADIIKAGAICLKLHEDWGTTPAAIDTCLRVADEYDIQVTIHTDTLNESGCVEETIKAIGDRCIHTYHSEGAGGGHAPDILKVCGLLNVLPSSTDPTRPYTINTVDEHRDMLMVCHHLDKNIAEDVKFADSRIRHQTISAEDILHDLGAISMISSDSQAMGRVGEVITRTWQTAHKMRRQRGQLAEQGGPDIDNFRVKRYIAKYTINPAIAHGISHLVGSVEVGKLADLVLWKPEFFGAKPEIVIKGGTIAWAQMGDANGSIPTPEPKRMKPMFGATGKAGSLHSIAFVSQAAEKEGVKEKYNLQKKVEAVRNTRQLKKTDMKLNSATPDIDVDPTTFRTTADGVELTCQPASYLPLAQNYFLF